MQRPGLLRALQFWNMTVNDYNDARYTRCELAGIWVTEGQNTAEPRGSDTIRDFCARHAERWLLRVLQGSEVKLSEPRRSAIGDGDSKLDASARL